MDTLLARLGLALAIGQLISNAAGGSETRLTESERLAYGPKGFPACSAASSRHSPGRPAHRLCSWRAFWASRQPSLSKRLARGSLCFFSSA